ncbi:aspartyl-phosphate phosphatase Spo0E family protein [Paenibacillus thiaminolyticus]|uniref:Aspartyl-phosphate phosphatase Spo0E family protein n=1 Tax=Paenibacillus thiaminolyticus TaxID=49283 RepID=A0A3A3G9U9_PANTH|nr:aspartyl-phosphate phosphatase Spo0E family protein [Paenibacillus thiaminolyticus]RJG17890.1 aspartyl-phosphate phosphatase Spo0E family protein [Paenibacillus thiaminolyticus]
MATHDEELFILQKVEELRLRLKRAVGTIKSLSDERVVKLSQELDSYILQLQKKNYLNRAKANNTKRIAKMTEGS